VLVDVEEKIKNGQPLSSAFESQGIFPKIYTASILSGEKSGALDEVLLRYVEYLKRSVGVARKLRGALAYPAFLLAAAFLMIAFLTLYIVPRMSDLFRNLSGQRSLPTITLAVLWLSNAIAGNLWWLGPLVLISLFALYI
jgi:type IV pilus assembly protein PilC